MKGTMKGWSLGLLLACCLLYSGVNGDRGIEGPGRRLMASHRFKLHEQVVLYANKVGPFHNPR
jgi:hypothetical protein